MHMQMVDTGWECSWDTMLTSTGVLLHYKTTTEPTVSYTCNRKNNTIKFVMSMYKTGKTQDGNRYINRTHCWPCVKFLNSSVVVVQGQASLELVWHAQWTRTAGLSSSPLHSLCEQVRLQVSEVDSTVQWTVLTNCPGDCRVWIA